MPFRVTSILAATDLTPSAVPVLRSAAALAALTDADLHVIHIVDVEPGSEVAALDEARKGLHEQLRSTLPAQSVVTRAQVEYGNPAEVILYQAQQADADLIVIGPHRRRDEQHELGATADRLVRTATMPCLIVHRMMSLPLRRVLIPTDFSDAASGALDLGLVWSTALRIPSGRGEATEVEVVYIREGRAGDDPGHELHAQVEDACARTGCGHAFDIVEHVIDEDDAAAGILRVAREHDVDLVVLGTHGEHERRRERIGSVSSAVARDAGTPVLLAPPGYWAARREREAALRGR